MKLILSSCDFGNPESAQCIYDHLGIPIEQCRVLFIPNEKATKEKIRGGRYELRLAQFGFGKEHIHVFDYDDPKQFTGLEIDAVYISGGNTFGTMQRIRNAGFDRAIIDYVRGGAVYIGGSAGAHIASASIAHVAKYDFDTFGVTDFSGLGLYHGIFVCHYDGSRAEDARQLKAFGEYPVTVLTDSESLVVNDRDQMICS